MHLEYIAFLYLFFHFSVSASTDTVNRTRSSGNTQKMDTSSTTIFRCAVGRRAEFMLTFVVVSTHEMKKNLGAHDFLL